MSCFPVTSGFGSVNGFLEFRMSFIHNNYVQIKELTAVT